MAAPVGLVLPLLVLVAIVCASAAQTEAASYLSLQQGYDRPFFAFYLTHGTFTLVFPLHLLYLYAVDRHRVPTHLGNLRRVIVAQLADAPPLLPARFRWRRDKRAHSVAAPPAGAASPGASGFSTVSTLSAGSRSARAHRGVLADWAKRVVFLTVLVSVPALSWYVAMALTTAMDVTALYATSSFHAYFFSMALLGHGLSRLTVGSIAVAFAGVVVLTFDAVGQQADGSAAGGTTGDGAASWAGRMTGDIIMALGAAALGLYEVVYKILLPASEGGAAPALPPTDSLRTSSDIALVRDRHGSRTPLLKDDDDGADADELDAALTRTSSRRSASSARSPSGSCAAAHASPHALPPALHANFLTSCIGLATLALLWPPIIVLHVSGAERFLLPSGAQWLSMAVVCAGGASYNAGLMVLIGMWGPTTSSVANLLTIGLVAVADAVWMGNIPDVQTMCGAAMICAGFAVLLYEGEA